MQLFVSIIVSVFMIGLVVFSFLILSVGIEDASYETTTDTGITEGDFNLTSTGGGNNLTTCGGGRDSLINSITLVVNATGGETLDSGNYTYTSCILYPITDQYNNTLVNVTYAYSYTSNYDSYEVIRTAKGEVADVPDWFGLFILMGAMVVVILMIVMIISAIKQANVGGGSMGV